MQQTDKTSSQNTLWQTKLMIRLCGDGAGVVVGVVGVGVDGVVGAGVVGVVGVVLLVVLVLVLMVNEQSASVKLTLIFC